MKDAHYLHVICSTSQYDPMPLTLEILIGAFSAVAIAWLILIIIKDFWE